MISKSHFIRDPRGRFTKEEIEAYDLLSSIIKNKKPERVFKKAIERLYY